MVAIKQIVKAALLAGAIFISPVLASNGVHAERAMSSVPMLFAVTQTYEPVPADVCRSAPDNPACTASSTDPITGSNGIITTIANLLAWTAGGLAIIIIIFAGFRFVKSGGDASKVAQARETILYAAVGLIVIVLARLIVGLVISKTVKEIYETIRIFRTSTWNII